jgi:hypothetical protein
MFTSPSRSRPGTQKVSGTVLRAAVEGFDRGILWPDGVINNAVGDLANIAMVSGAHAAICRLRP